MWNGTQMVESKNEIYGGRFRIVREFFSAFIAGKPTTGLLRPKSNMNAPQTKTRRKPSNITTTNLCTGQNCNYYYCCHYLCCIGVVRHRLETVITNLMLSLLFCVRSFLFFAHALFNERLYSEQRDSRASMHLWLLDVDSSNWWLLLLSSGRSFAIICLASHRLTSLSSRSFLAVCVWLFW